MKKIMFNDRYGLTETVLSGRKTMTRRIITCPKTFKGVYVAGFHVYKRQSDGAILEWPSLYDADESTIDGGYILPKYKVGEIVAVAQSYNDMGYDADALDRSPKDINIVRGLLGQSAGWNNKMFVRVVACKNQIRITNVRVERLQEISDEDCLKEGIVSWTKDRELFKYDLGEDYEIFEWCDKPYSPREAFAALIDKVSGKGTWESNPFVLAYDFELVK